MKNNYMKTTRKKVSLTMSSEVFAEVDRQRRANVSRSAFIEGVLRDHFNKRERDATNQRDLELMNANAEYLNREMEVVLKHQAPIDFSSEEK